MTNPFSLTPLGCGPILAGEAKKQAANLNAFPCDLNPRVEELNLGAESLYLAWEISCLADTKIGAENKRAITILALSALLASYEGSTRIAFSSAKSLKRVLDIIQATDSERSAVADLIKQVQKTGQPAEIFGGPDSYRPLIIDHDCLYIQKLHVLESQVGKALHDRIICPKHALPAPGNIPAEEALIEVFSSPPIGHDGEILLDQEQQKAVETALNGKITVINGRPGSGKTSVVASILRVIARTGYPPLESVALAAPTGKAADRMSQSIADHLAAISDAGKADRRLFANCPPSSTLHRLLGYSPGTGRFRHNENNPLSEKYVIIDESSMIDLPMMNHLLRALQPDAQLVFLGDADQLPSIEAGAVLRSLCQAKSAIDRGRVVTLKKSYRAREENRGGKKILEVAAAINDGNTAIEAGAGKALQIRSSVAELQFEGVEQLCPGSEAQKRELYNLWLERLQNSIPDINHQLARCYSSGPAGFDADTTEHIRGIIAKYELYKILCATRITAGGAGSDNVNKSFHAQWAAKLAKAGIESGSRQFLIGEPVIVTRNDYKLRLYNGDSGLVLQIKSSDGERHSYVGPMAIFPRSGRLIAYPLEALRGKLDLAWATTVHKAQGSEYSNVAIILPDIHVRPLTRELLYTAVTRAKTSVIIAGPGEILNTAINLTMQRESGLADLL